MEPTPGGKSARRPRITFFWWLAESRRPRPDEKEQAEPAQTAEADRTERPAA